jgi:anti-sigma factor RsiW
MRDRAVTKAGGSDRHRLDERGRRSACLVSDRHRPVALDTSDEVHARQVARWRAMSPSERAALVEVLSADVTEMALTDIRREHTRGSAGERRELVARRYGRSLADEVYGPEG